MAVQKRKKHTRLPLHFKWTVPRKKAAFLLSLGTKTIDDVWTEVGINERTLFDWRSHPEFKKEVDRLTFEHELASKAGLLRLAYKAVDNKIENLKNDKNTVLDWAEFIVKILPDDTKEDNDKLKELTDAIMNSAKMIGK